MGNGTKRTEEERISIMRRVDELRSQGRTVKEATREVGVYGSLYQQWQRKYGTTTSAEAKGIETSPQVTFTELQKEPRKYLKSKTGKKILIIQCDADALSEVTRSLWQ